MATAQQEDTGHNQRKFSGPYTSHHPVPTIQRYEQHQEERNAQPTVPDGSRDNEVGGQPYEAKNLNTEQTNGDGPNHSYPNGYYDNDQARHGAGGDSGVEQRYGNNDGKPQKKPAEVDSRQEREDEEPKKEEHAGREVTDPVTHLPVTIHDSNKAELKNAPENLAPAGSELRTSTSAKKSRSQLDKETEEEQKAHRGMEKLFPPPKFDVMGAELAQTYQMAATVGLGLVLAAVLAVMVLSQMLVGHSQRSVEQRAGSWFGLLLPYVAVVLVGTSLGTGIIWVLQGWLKNKVKDAWEDEVWEAARPPDGEGVDEPTPESTQWLNYLLASIWPLVNPDLFTSLADTLEDVMQASLPKFVRMISVEDLGQGSEAIRILGVRWLPTGTWDSLKINCTLLR